MNQYIITKKYITITFKTKQYTKINLNKKYIGVCFGIYNLIIRKNEPIRN